MKVFKWIATDPYNESCQFSISVCANTAGEAHWYLISRLKTMKRMDIAFYHQIYNVDFAAPRWSEIWATYRQKPGHWKTVGLLDNTELVRKQGGLLYTENLPPIR